MLAVIAAGSVCHAAEIEGFIEPYKTIAIASPATGVIAKLDVKEGTAVHQGEVLAILDNREQQAELAVAKARMNARASLDAARARYARDNKRLHQLQSLFAQGSARSSEVDQARSDVAVALADVKRAKEDRTIAHLDYDRIEAEIAMRTMTSPIDGVVVAIKKEVGELVATGDQTVMIVAQLDPLLITVHAPANLARTVTQGDKVAVTVPSSQQPVPGLVELVAPIVNPESGTVKIKVRLDNPQGRYRSGTRAQVRIGDPPGDSVAPVNP